MSSSIPQILKEDSFGTFFLTAHLICIVGYALVDDKNLIQSSKDGQKVAEVNVQIQKAMDLCEGLITAL